LAGRFLFVPLGDFKEDRSPLFGHCRIGEFAAPACPIMQLLRPAQHRLALQIPESPTAF
jgi:hypothetical protein